MQGRKHIQPKMMYEVSLDTLVSNDNFYRQLNTTLDLSFLYKETAAYYGSEGQESIDPVVFFKICLVGYFNNINSDRRLIDFCSNRLDLRLYLQYDIDETLPWHSTISRTRQLYGEEVFLSLFKKILSLCVEKGMVRGKRQAIDSAFVKANASLDSLVAKEVLSDADVYADELNQGSEYKINVQKTDDFSSKTDGDTTTKKTGNKTHYSTTDPDARISTKPGKVCGLNYYGQIAVDDAHHVITGANADFADRRDSQCLEKIADQTIENLKQNNLTIQQVIADTNYSSAEVLLYLEEKNIDAYIPNVGGYKQNREGFFYNQELDRYECTRGNKAMLPFVKVSTKENGNTRKIYLSSSKKCKDCPLRSTCIGKSSVKKIADSTDKPLYNIMHQKMQTAYGKRMGRIRSKTVEPVLGTLINFLNMKRVNARGIEQANKQVIMAALCYNLKKYLKFISKKGKCVAMALTHQPEMNMETMKAFFMKLTNSILNTLTFETKNVPLKLSALK
jgi:transposase